jgi:hypothetical protein
MTIERHVQPVLVWQGVCGAAIVFATNGAKALFAGFIRVTSDTGKKPTATGVTAISALGWRWGHDVEIGAVVTTIRLVVMRD